MSHKISLLAIVREMDANELEAKASELVLKKNSRAGLTGEEQEALWAIPNYYKQLTNENLIVETNQQLVS